MKIGVGIVAETQQLIEGSLAEEVARKYSIVPEEDMRRGEIEAGGPCTIPVCWSRVGGALNAGRVITLEVAPGAEGLDLRLSVRRGEQAFQDVETCLDCGPGEISAKIAALVEKVAGKDLETPPSLRELAKTEPEMAPQREEPKVKGPLDDIPLWVWIVGGSVGAALLAGMAGGGGGGGGGTVDFTW